MTKADILKALEDDSKYYGEFGQQYLSNSDIGKLLKNPTQFRVSSEFTKPMLEGRYFHTKILEPHKLDDFQVVDVASRNTVRYKEKEAEVGEMLLLKKALCPLTKSMVPFVRIFLFFFNLFLVISFGNLI